MTATTTHGRPRRLALAALTLAATCSVSACQITSPITTDLDYDPADGVSAETEFAEALDLLVISEGNGAPGVLTGYVVNSGEESLVVEFAVEIDGERLALKPSVKVPADDSTRTDGRASDDDDFTDPVTIDRVATIPGSLITVRVTTSAGGTASKRVPVLPPDGIYEPYAEVISGLGSKE